MQMAAEGAIELGQEPGSLAVSATFTAIVEGRAAKTVDNNFFLVNVPIGNCETQTLVNKFPRVGFCAGCVWVLVCWRNGVGGCVFGWCLGSCGPKGEKGGLFFSPNHQSHPSDTQPPKPKHRSSTARTSCRRRRP